MNDLELAWVAGLLEGEGCFTVKGNAGIKRNIAVRCQMTDKDVLDRLATFVGVEKAKLV